MKKLTLCSDSARFLRFVQHPQNFSQIFLAEGAQTIGPVFDCVMVRQQNLAGCRDLSLAKL